MKIWEVIKELAENPEKKFVNDNKVVPGKRTAYVNEFGCIVVEDGHGSPVPSINIERGWEEVKEPVSFIEVLEVVNARGVGVQITFENDKYGVDFKRHSLYFIISELGGSYDSQEIANILLNSKFYIED